MFAREGFGTTDARDASLADFSHELGHDCAHCRAIRSLGPAGFTSIIGRLIDLNIQRAEGELTTDEEAERAVASLPRKQQRKAARLAHKRNLRGIKGLLLAIQSAA